MPRKIRIVTPGFWMEAMLNQTRTADLVWDAVPFDSRAKRWGDEVYFECPVDADEENPKARVPSGTIAYWPPGKCFCIFFGQTPYSPVNVVGVLDGDPTRFAAVKEGDRIRLEQVEATQFEVE